MRRNLLFSCLNIPFIVLLGICCSFFTSLLLAFFKTYIHKKINSFHLHKYFSYLCTYKSLCCYYCKIKRNKLFYSNFCRHTTRDIIEALPNVGLVINLTNTQTGTKYYEPNDWKSRDIDYKWIKVEGE